MILQVTWLSPQPIRRPTSPLRMLHSATSALPDVPLAHLVRRRRGVCVPADLVGSRNPATHTAAASCSIADFVPNCAADVRIVNPEDSRTSRTPAAARSPSACMPYPMMYGLLLHAVGASANDCPGGVGVSNDLEGSTDSETPTPPHRFSSPASWNPPSSALLLLIILVHALARAARRRAPMGDRAGSLCRPERVGVARGNGPSTMGITRSEDRTHEDDGAGGSCTEAAVHLVQKVMPVALDSWAATGSHPSKTRAVHAVDTVTPGGARWPGGSG